MFKMFIKLLVVALIATTANARTPRIEKPGTGAGGGDDGAPSRRSGEVGDEMRSSSNSSVSYLYEWCANATYGLQREMRRSNILLNQGNLAEAKRILGAALKNAGRSYHHTGAIKPMTKKLIDRGVKYLSVIDNLVGSEPARLKVVSQLNFLTEYIQLIIDTERKLDRPYHIPYHYEYDSCRRGCGGSFSVTDYEAAFVSQMRDELNFVVNNFTALGNRNNHLPLGTPEVYLKVAQVLSNGVAIDLAENLYAYKNSCSVVDLKNLSDDLNDFNYHRDRTYFSSEPHAVHETSTELQRVAGNLYPRAYYTNGHRTHRSRNYRSGSYGSYGCEN